MGTNTPQSHRSTGPIDLAFKSVRSAITSFHPASLPPMMRFSYGRELKAWWLLPLMLGTIEGGVIGVIVRKSFDGVAGISEAVLNFAVAAVVAAPALANIASFIWAFFTHGRDKVKFITALLCISAAFVALIAISPRSSFGLFLLCLSVYGARVCWSGVMLLRTAVWRNNYPRADRARVAGKLASVQAIVMCVVAYGLGLSMDFNENSFRVLFPVAAVGGLIGAFVYARLRLRGSRKLMRDERNGSADELLTLNPYSLRRLLERDGRFRQFMINMFALGLGNLMILAPLAIILQERFGLNYQHSILITAAIPTLMMPFTIPLWARFFDRHHVVEFRAIHSWVFVCVSAGFLLACITHQVWLLYATAVVLGIAYGGGVLAWNLGHHDFADDHNASHYMGVHVTLTGIRGLIAPFLSVGLYEALELLSPGSGMWVFLPCLVLNLVGAVGFAIMRRDLFRDSSSLSRRPTVEPTIGFSPHGGSVMARQAR